MSKKPTDFVIVRNIYNTIRKLGEHRYFEELGLTRDASWEEFRAHYGDNEEIANYQAVYDVCRYPPYTEKMGQAAILAGDTPEAFLSDLLADIERCQADVLKYERPEDLRALAEGRGLLKEVLKIGSFKKH